MKIFVLIHVSSRCAGHGEYIDNYELAHSGGAPHMPVAFHPAFQKREDAEQFLAKLSKWDQDTIKIESIELI